MKFGLRNMRYLLRSVGNPENSFPSIHVAGTNGKGSTSAFLASILMEAGCKAALYTSPHLVRFTERIRIDGREMSERRLVAYAAALRPAIEHVRATFFEATTCIAFRYFADEGVDIAVIEAGLGGRLDSTNVLLPLISVITNVGLDHTELLGRTIGAIAREKGGIIKRGIPCVTGSTDPDALKAFTRIAASRGTSLARAQRIVRCAVEPNGGSAGFKSRSFSLSNVRLGLSGGHQVTNARVALAALDVVRRRRTCPTYLKKIGSAEVRRGLKNVTLNTGLRGRLETFDGPHRYILDVAHNPPGVQCLVESLQSQGLKNLVVVFGVMKDKDSGGMLDELARIASVVIAVAPGMKRAVRPETLYHRILRNGIPVRYGGTVPRGLTIAEKLSRRTNPVLVTGSHYVVGEALRFLGRKKA